MDVPSVSGKIQDFLKGFYWWQCFPEYHTIFCQANEPNLPNLTFLWARIKHRVVTSQKLDVLSGQKRLWFCGVQFTLTLSLLPAAVLFVFFASVDLAGRCLLHILSFHFCEMHMWGKMGVFRDAFHQRPLRHLAMPLIRGPTMQSPQHSSNLQSVPKTVNYDNTKTKKRINKILIFFFFSGFKDNFIRRESFCAPPLLVSQLVSPT